jgi:hypothetical protein
MGAELSMNNSTLTDLFPTFLSGLYALRSDLINVAFVIAFAGLLTHVCSALFRNDLKAFVAACRSGESVDKLRQSAAAFLSREGFSTATQMMCGRCGYPDVDLRCRCREEELHRQIQELQAHIFALQCKVQPLEFENGQLQGFVDTANRPCTKADVKNRRFAELLETALFEDPSRVDHQEAIGLIAAVRGSKSQLSYLH